MKSNNKNIYIISALFLLFFGIKAWISFYFKGTFFYSDEACVVQKAAYLAQRFSIESCSFVTNAPTGDPLPFYSILLAPVFIFFKGINGYFGSLVLNSLLTAGLIFPVFKIAEKFNPGKKINILIAAIIPFLPQVIVYEKTLLTETAFLAVLIWGLWFYIKSFSKNPVRNKIITFIFFLAATLTRPFGVIALLAFGINEFIISKKKKRTTLIVGPIIILGITLAAIALPNLLPSVLGKIKMITDPESLKLLVVAIKNQLNSFTIATCLIPIILFFTFIFEKQPKELKNIRWFLLTFIALNFAASTNHIHDYLLDNDITNLITRYISSSVVLLWIFALIFLNKYKKFKLHALNFSLAILLLISFFFLSFEKIKHSLNLDISLYYDTTKFFRNNVISSNDFIVYYFLPLCLILFVLMIRNNKKILTTVLAVFILIQSGLLYAWEQNFTKVAAEKDSLYQYFKEEKTNIFLLTSYKKRAITFSYWNLLNLTENRVSVMYINDIIDQTPAPDYNNENFKTILSQYDYLVTIRKIDGLGEPIKIINEWGIYKITK